MERGPSGGEREKNLGGHPQRGALGHVLVLEHGVGVLHLRETKVADLDAPVLINQQVRSLEVAVDEDRP